MGAPVTVRSPLLYSVVLQETEIADSALILKSAMVKKEKDCIFDDKYYFRNGLQSFQISKEKERLETRPF